MNVPKSTQAVSVNGLAGLLDDCFIKQHIVLEFALIAVPN
jgi:hypothetical protein